MVDSISGFAAAQLKNVHNFAKSIEVANFGKHYASFADSVDYYGTELVVKPILHNTPEWVTDNRAVATIQNNRVASILGSTALVLLFLILIHPNKEPVDPIKKPDPAAGSGAVNGTREAEDADESEDAEETHESDEAEDANEAEDAEETHESEEAEEAAEDDDADEVDETDSLGAAAAAAAASAAAAPPPSSSSSSSAGAAGGKDPV